MRNVLALAALLSSADAFSPSITSCPPKSSLYAQTGADKRANFSSYSPYYSDGKTAVTSGIIGGSANDAPQSGEFIGAAGNDMRSFTARTNGSGDVVGARGDDWFRESRGGKDLAGGRADRREIFSSYSPHYSDGRTAVTSGIIEGSANDSSQSGEPIGVVGNDMRDFAARTNGSVDVIGARGDDWFRESRGGRNLAGGRVSSYSGPWKLAGSSASSSTIGSANVVIAPVPPTASSASSYRVLG